MYGAARRPGVLHIPLIESVSDVRARTISPVARGKPSRLPDVVNRFEPGGVLPEPAVRFHTVPGSTLS
jgi:hypothetical protein